MANEAVLMYELEVPIPFTVADGTAIPKGTLLKLSDPMTAAAQDGANDVIAGIAAEDKVASDGKTKLGVYRRGIFKMLAKGNITAGDLVEASSTANGVVTGTQTANATANLVGLALETAADTETFLVELRPWQDKDPA